MLALPTVERCSESKILMKSLAFLLLGLMLSHKVNRFSLIV